MSHGLQRMVHGVKEGKGDHEGRTFGVNSFVFSEMAFMVSHVLHVWVFGIGTQMHVFYGSQIWLRVVYRSQWADFFDTSDSLLAHWPQPISFPLLLLFTCHCTSPLLPYTVISSPLGL